MTIFPAFERQLVELAARAPSVPRERSGAHARARRILRGLPAAIVIASAAGVTIAIAALAVVFLRPADHSPTTGGSGERRLLAQYSVLRRPQTAADRLDSGPAPRLGGSRDFGGGGWAGPGQEFLHYSVRITGLARYHDVPGLTRVVSVDGVQVSLFVERLSPRHTLPKATITGNNPAQAARRTTRASLEAMERRANAEPRYVLVARVGRSGRHTLIASSLGLTGSRSGRLAAEINGLVGVTTASLPAPGGRIVAVVPDGVARISLSWPREFDSQALTYDPPVTISAPVHGNVAVARAPARFSEAEQIGPETVVRYAAAGNVIARLSDPGNSASVQLTTTWDGQTPGPETGLSRRAERNPSTPNRVVLAPSVVTLQSARAGAGPGLFFAVLLSHRTYFVRLTGGPRPNCISGASNGGGYGQTLHPGDEPTVRGDTFLDNVPLSPINCAGRYKVSVSILGPGGKPYPPFGSATLTVR